MNPKILLRIASVLMFLHTIGHSFGALNWKNAPDAAVGRLITSMQTTHFAFMGRSATLAGFYEGYGLSMIFVLLLISAVLWLLSTAVTEELSFRLLPLFAGFLFILGIIEYIYFFPFAAGFSLLAAVCSFIARIRMKPVTLKRTDLS
ncbi:MAG TPA: hypothetical protein VL727_16515 [Puia sp.]|nr:hypothetical protein [Puia sp.]